MFVKIVRPLAATLLAALLIVTLAARPAWSQDKDEKKPGEKTPAAKKPGLKDEKKGKGKDEEPKSGEDAKGGDLTPVQEKLLEKLKLAIEKKFPKSKGERIYVVYLTDVSYEAPGVEPSAPPEKGDKKRSPRGEGAGGAPAWGGSYQQVVKREAAKIEGRDAAIDRVTKFMTEYPPADPKTKAKKGADGPPPPHREWDLLGSYSNNKAGIAQADQTLERAERDAEKKNRADEWKRKDKMKR